MGHRSTAALPILVLLLFAPLLGGCALLFATSVSGTSSGAPSPVVAMASAVAMASPVSAPTSTPPGSPTALPTPEQLAPLLGPDDFTSVGVAGAGTPTFKGEPGSALVVYKGPSSGGGGIEMDVFIAATPADAAAMVFDPGMHALDAASKQAIGADRAIFIGDAATNEGTSTYDTIWIQKGRLVADIGIPTTPTSRDQLVALAKLVLDRSADYE